jgi:hypothetical protein
VNAQADARGKARIFSLTPLAHCDALECCRKHNSRAHSKHTSGFKANMCEVATSNWTMDIPTVLEQAEHTYESSNQAEHTWDKP